MHRFSKILVILLSLIFSFVASARYATHEEAAVEIDFYNSDIEVQKDGKFTNLVESQTTILNEVGREGYGSQTLIFTKDVSNIEILEAKTILGGVEYKLENKDIEIKPLASSEKGFDQKYQILLAFPQVVVGSKLYLKYKETVTTPIISNHYENRFTYGISQYTKNSKIKLTSYIPFDYLVNDPDKNLEVQFVQDKSKKILIISQKKPIFYQISNEPYSTMLDRRKLSSIYVSTFKSFDELAKILAPNYERAINQILPKLYKDIIAEATKITKEEDQINYVISELNNKIRYMGSWQTVKGKIYPRNLEEITATGFGDCKDFSVSTASMLHRLGYKVNSILVFRENHYIENPTVLPSLLFNHAILVATSKSGKTYWLDPTNFVSMSSGIFPDISNRKSLILDSKSPKYESTPSIDPNHSVNFLDTIFSINEEFINLECNIKLLGERAINITGSELTTSKIALEEDIITYFSGESKPIDKSIDLPDLKSRIVKDIAFNFLIKKENDFFISNLGEAIPLTHLAHQWINNIVKLSDDVVGVLYISDPTTYNYKTTIKNYTAQNIENLNFELDSKWFKAKRECSQVGDDIVIKETTILLNPVILPEDLKNEEFATIKKKIKQYMLGSVLVGKAKK